MSRRISCSILLLLVGWAGPVAAAYHYYVDPVNGNDSWNGWYATYQGGSNGPKQTLPAVKNSVRAHISSGLDNDIYVNLRGGRYELSGTLTFTTADCHATYRVTWRNYSGEVPRISGGRVVNTTWYYDNAWGFWYTTIPDVQNGTWWFRDLYRDDVRMVRSRWPNAPIDSLCMGWSGGKPNHANLCTANSVSGDRRTITLNTAPPSNLAGTHRAELVDFRSWLINRALVSSSSGTTVNTATAMGSGIGSWSQMAAGDKCYLENSYTFIDQDNEWALATWGGLYYRGSDPRNDTFIAPNIEQLVVVQGSEGNRVKNLTFQGLRFEHANWNLPAEGYQGHQAGFRYVGSTSTPPPAAITFTYTEDCELKYCQVRFCAAAGVHLSVGSYNDTVEGCSLHNLGSIGILAGHPNTWSEGYLRTAYGYIHNNYVQYVGRQYFDAAGIWEAFMRYTEISRNLVAYLPYTGISAGWAWGPNETTQQNILITYNWVHDVMRFMNDGGGIYTLGAHPNSTIGHNLVENVGWSGQFVSGLYADEGSSYMTWYGNVVNNMLWGHCYNQNPNSWSVAVNNNIFLNAGAGELHRWQPTALGGFSLNLTRNIVWMWTTDAYVPSSNPSEWSRTSEYNVDLTCYYRPGGGTKTFDGNSWSTWRSSMGNDANSYYQQDPMFQDASHASKNYLLQASSPLLGAPMNFSQVQVQYAGPY